MSEVPWRVVYEVPCPTIALGTHRFDVRHRALVCGVVEALPGTAAQGATCDGLGALVDAARQVDEGADALEVQGPDGDGGAEVLAGVVGALRDRVSVPIVVATSSESALRAALTAGADAGRARSLDGIPGYFATAAGSGASVILTDPAGGRAPGAVAEALRLRAEEAASAGVPREGVVIDAGLDAAVGGAPLATTVLHRHDDLASLGWPVAVGLPAGGPDGEDAAALAVAALGISLGSRLLRTRRVRAARRVADVLAAVLEARTP